MENSHVDTRWKTNSILVQTVLSAMAIFHLMSLNPPPWFFKAVDKICRAFLWKGTETVSGGHCLVAWPLVCRPKPKGGLGIIDLQVMHSALQGVGHGILELHTRPAVL